MGDKQQWNKIYVGNKLTNSFVSLHGLELPGQVYRMIQLHYVHSQAHCPSCSMQSADLYLHTWMCLYVHMHYGFFLMPDLTFMDPMALPRADKPCA